VTEVSAAAQVQRRLWGTNPEAWAELSERHNVPLFEAVLDAAAVGPGMRLLDVGCGSGLALSMAAERGALLSGIDISTGLLAVARQRCPDADLRDGDMEDLPFADETFDAVIGINAFQFAGDPIRAMREATRIVRRGGRVVASLFAAPERSEGTVAHEAMSALIPPESTGEHAPYSLSTPGNLEAALTEAGLRVVGDGEAVCVWRYDSMDDAVLGLLSSAGGARASEAAGAARVDEVLRRALARFEGAHTGVVRMTNTFRWVAAVRGGGAQARSSKPALL
jgi:SAM-dependent methyltransferase